MSTGHVFCTKCGANIPDSSRFCTSCGAPVEKTPKVFCTVCGTEISEGSRFCKGCGSPVGIKTPEPVDEITETVDAPVNEEPAPAPVNEEPAPAPVNEEPAPAPVNEEPAPELVNEKPAPEPVNEEPAPAPVNVEPAPAPVNEEPAPAPVYEQPAPAPVYQAPQQYAPAPQYAPVYAPQPTCAPAARRISARDIFKSITLLIISVILTVSFFLPVTSMPIELDDEEKYTLKVSGFEHMTFFFDALYSKSSEELSESDLYYDYKDITDIEDDEFEDYSYEKRNKLVNRVYKIQLKLSLRHEDVKVPTSMIVTFALTAFYAFFTVIFLITSIVSVFKAFGGRICCRAATSLLCLITAVTPVYFYAAKSSEIFANSYDLETKLETLPLILAAVSLGLILVYSVIRAVSEKAKVRVSAVIKRTVSIAVCLFMVFAATMPVLSVSLRGNFRNEGSRRVETTLNAEYFGQFNNATGYKKLSIYNEARIREILKSTITDSASTLEWCEPRNIREGKANFGVFRHLALNAFSYEPDAAPMYEYLPVIYTATLFIASMLIWYNLNAAANGKRSNAFSVIFKLLAFVGSLGALAIVIIFMYNSAQNVAVSELTFKCAPSYGIILFVTAALVLACIPLNSRREK